MSFSDDFMPGDPNLDAGPAYPVVFGITLTPVISGVLLALLGLGAGAYLLMNFVQPERQKNQDLQRSVNEKNDQVAKQALIIRQVEKAQSDLATAKQQQKDVLALFANPTSLDTLLLDVNRQIEARSAGLARTQQERLAACPARVRNNLREFETQLSPLVVRPLLRKFAPKGAPAPVTDGSYGSLVNGKLNRQIYDVELEGNFNQIQSILRSIERLQPLLVFKNLDLKTAEARRFFQVQGNSLRLVPNCQPETKITATFQLDALLPTASTPAATPAAK